MQQEKQEEADRKPSMSGPDSLRTNCKRTHNFNQEKSTLEGLHIVEERPLRGELSPKVMRRIQNDNSTIKE